MHQFIKSITRYILISKIKNLATCFSYNETSSG